MHPIFAFSQSLCSQLDQCGHLGQIGPGFMAGVLSVEQLRKGWWTRVGRNGLPGQGTPERFVFPSFRELQR